MQQHPQTRGWSSWGVGCPGEVDVGRPSKALPATRTAQQGNGLSAGQLRAQGSGGGDGWGGRELEAVFNSSGSTLCSTN